MLDADILNVVKLSVFVPLVETLKHEILFEIEKYIFMLSTYTSL
jgi:hypothetical protein